MKNMIEPHYEDEDIIRLNLFTDVNKWKSEVTFINLENRFYKKLFSSSLIEKTTINKQDIQFLQKELEALQAKNEKLEDKLQEFTNELEGIKECDDLQCETFFLNNHQQFKIDIENYFFQNRNLKTLIFSYIENGIKKFL
ncbi:MAG TPA: hypothetical protein VFM59_02960 [Salinimicrobium sp.]|nr:hypothetical protein [Salinimicrobium sp.]